ncbi:MULTISPECIES: cytochrome b [unclassified Herbaspirillum]|uniref:cytochrome b n=1 Tax=unclassified Herbaspirillum TaxID=2624150 RepID=UPI0017BDFA9A|nr:MULTISPECIES: cytochrome b [unclassified Herbaspirillum]MBB5393129.1 cytochrome b561 [Herbaspirillum sp. SJZ102]
MGRGDPVSAAPSRMRGQARYDRVAVLLHWSIALLVLGMLALGYYMVGIPKGTPDRAVYFNLHKSCGVLAGVLVVIRLLWRLTHRPPAFPVDMAAWNIKAAQGGHLLLYALMVLQPLSGYLSSSFNKYGVKFFGLQLPRWATEDAGLRDSLMGYHKLLALLFAVLIALHVLAACKHLLSGRQHAARRMWF